MNPDQIRRLNELSNTFDECYWNHRDADLLHALEDLEQLAADMRATWQKNGRPE